MMFANLSPWHLRELHQQNQPSRAQDSQTARNATRQCVVFTHESLDPPQLSDSLHLYGATVFQKSCQDAATKMTIPNTLLAFPEKMPRDQGNRG